MSDVMLHGVLNMPVELWSDSEIDKVQRHSRYVQASERIRELKRLAALGEVQRAELAFETACIEFLKEKARSLKPSTLHGYKSKLEVYWSPLAHLDIRSIKLADLKAIDRDVDWQSQKTRRDAHAVLRGVFEWAISEELADDNPAKRLRAGAWSRKPVDAFSDEERLAILGELNGTARAFYGLMFETGARTGELMALRWEDVHRDEIRIAGSTYRGKVGTTKTHQERLVMLTNEAKRTLVAHTESRFKGEFVFLNQYGNPFAIDRGLTFAFKLACERAGVRYRRPYNCRHTFASRAIMAGANPAWVAKQMGDLVETVHRHYAQWIKGSSDRVELEKLNSVGNLLGTKREGSQ